MQLSPVRLLGALLVVLLLQTPALAESAEDLPAFRWGLGLGPSLRVTSVPVQYGDDISDQRTVAFGLTAVAARLGYQFPHMGIVGLSLYGEPRLGYHAKSVDNVTAHTLGLVGSLVLQCNVGRYFFAAFGLSVGGDVFIVNDKTGRSGAMGGFTLRLGANFPLASSGPRPRAITLAFETLSLFAPTDVLNSGGRPISSGRQETGSVTTIGVAVGFDSY